MKQFLKNTAITIVLLILVLVFGFITGRQEIEKRIIFKPSSVTKPLFSEYSEKASMKTFRTSNGLELSYLHIKGDHGKPVILFCHGNDTNITYEKIQKKLVFLAQKGYEIYALDYRGYGKSQGSPDEQGLYSDVDEFISYLSKTFGFNTENTIIWGHSLGAAVAINTAVNHKFRGVIAEGGFTSINDMRTFRIQNDDKGSPIANSIRDFVYNSLEIKQEFNNKEKIKAVKSPMLILHGKNDTTTPYQMSVKLAELKPEANTYFPEDGGHSAAGWQDSAILEFINSLKFSKN